MASARAFSIWGESRRKMWSSMLRRAFRIAASSGPIPSSGCTRSCIGWRSPRFSSGLGTGRPIHDLPHLGAERSHPVVDFPALGTGLLEFREARALEQAPELALGYEAQALDEEAPSRLGDPGLAEARAVQARRCDLHGARGGVLPDRHLAPANDVELALAFRASDPSEGPAEVLDVCEWSRAIAVSPLRSWRTQQALVVGAVVPIVDQHGEQAQRIALGADLARPRRRSIELVPAPAFVVASTDALALEATLDRDVAEIHVAGVVDRQRDVAVGSEAAAMALCAADAQVGVQARGTAAQSVGIRGAAVAAQLPDHVHVVCAGSEGREQPARSHFSVHLRIAVLDLQDLAVRELTPEFPGGARGLRELEPARHQVGRTEAMRAGGIAAQVDGSGVGRLEPEPGPSQGVLPLQPFLPRARKGTAGAERSGSGYGGSSHHHAQQRGRALTHLATRDRYGSLQTQGQERARRQLTIVALGSNQGPATAHA